LTLELLFGEACTFISILIGSSGVILLATLSAAELKDLKLGGHWFRRNCANIDRALSIVRAAILRTIRLLTHLLLADCRGGGVCRHGGNWPWLELVIVLASLAPRPQRVLLGSFEPELPLQATGGARRTLTVSSLSLDTPRIQRHRA